MSQAGRANPWGSVESILELALLLLRITTVSRGGVLKTELDNGRSFEHWRGCIVRVCLGSCTEARLDGAHSLSALWLDW